jgi:hypothetical protein
MHKPDPVETILARLMPPGLSESGQRDIEAMLDELAGETQPAAPPAPKPWHRRIAATGIAAAGVAVACIFPGQPPVAKHAAATHEPAGILLVSETDRVESMTDEGWQEDSDGSAMRTMRLSVVEENSLLDEQTGIVMQIIEPREEFLFVPVSTF